MGFKSISLKMPVDYSPEDLDRAVGRQLKIREFEWNIEAKSLDARERSRIRWELRLLVRSPQLPGPDPAPAEELPVPRRKRDGRVVIVGSGPAGIFAGLVLQRAGFRTTLLERGSEVDVRDRAVREFEAAGVFNSRDNYAFGEGGAGTFSDGKLTSRSKHISRERQFILDSYVRAGAPEEISYLAHPHLGTDNLMGITRELRAEYQGLGGEILFDTLLEDLTVQAGRVTAAVTTRGTLDVSRVVIASGHSAYETYRMLMRRGVAFRTKNFALGCRVEHPQEIINRAQWGVPVLPGVKAAEYRLSAQPPGGLPVYTFCMCPGGVVVPAAAYPQSNIVNGMSRYRRDGKFANAACVVGVDMDTLAGRELSAPEALDWLEALELRFHRWAGEYRAPFSTIDDFLRGTVTPDAVPTSYPLGIVPAPLAELLPAPVAASLKPGWRIFPGRSGGSGRESSWDWKASRPPRFRSSGRSPAGAKVFPISSWSARAAAGPAASCRPGRTESGRPSPSPLSEGARPVHAPPDVALRAPPPCAILKRPWPTARSERSAAGCFSRSSPPGWRRFCFSRRSSRCFPSTT